MKRTNYLVPIVVSCVLATGCVSKKQFAELQTDYRQLQTENNDLSKSYQQAQVTLAENRANIKSLEERLAEAQQNNADLKASYASLQGSLDKSIQQGNINISKLVDEINASNRFIKQLVEAKDKSDSLNMVLTNNLTRSLTKDELQEVDLSLIHI